MQWRNNEDKYIEIWLKWKAAWNKIQSSAEYFSGPCETKRDLV
jgi:hypothetical protein